VTSLCAPTAPVSEHVERAFGPYLGGPSAHRLNLGCGRSVEPGFRNLDRVVGAGVDIVQDLEVYGQLGRFALPLAPPGSLDFVLASHVLEHIQHLIPLMRAIHAALKPGGHLGLVAPYASSDDAWEDPTHVRAFTEKSWAYFDRRLYERPDHYGSYTSDVDFCFEVESLYLVPYEAVVNDPDLENKKRYLRNIIREQIVVLRKVEA
jgi:SAM-dependent methyltransferase